MTDECRGYREMLGDLAIGRLTAAEQATLEAHLETCEDCRAEAARLQQTAALLPLVETVHIFETPPSPPAGLEKQIQAEIHREQKQRRTRKRRFAFSGFALAGATVAAIVVISLSGSTDRDRPSAQQLTFDSVPAGVEINGTLNPKATGTEISLNVTGVRSGTLCQVYVRQADGSISSAGSFRYRYDYSGEPPVLSTGVDLSEIDQIEIKAGPQTFKQQV